MNQRSKREKSYKKVMTNLERRKNERYKERVDSLKELVERLSGDCFDEVAMIKTASSLEDEVGELVDGLKKGIWRCD